MYELETVCNINRGDVVSIFGKRYLVAYNEPEERGLRDDPCNVLLLWNHNGERVKLMISPNDKIARGV